MDLEKKIVSACEGGQVKYDARWTKYAAGVVYILLFWINKPMWFLNFKGFYIFGEFIFLPLNWFQNLLLLQFKRIKNIY